MRHISLYAALLLSKDGYSVFIPSINQEFKVKDISNIDVDVTEQLVPQMRQGLYIGDAMTDAIMPVVHKTRRQLKLMGRSTDEYIDTVKVNLILEEV